MAKDNLKALYHLSRMPFELGRYDSARVNRDTEWKRLHEVVESARGSHSPVIGVLLGTYGSGKTFLLWQLADDYSPSNKTGVVASHPIRLVDPEQKREFIRNLVLRLFRRGFDLDALVPLFKVAAKARKALPSAVARFAPLLLALADAKAAPVARRVLHGGRALKSEAAAGGFPDAVQVRTNDDAIELLQSLQVLVRWAGIDIVTLMIDEVEFIDGLPRTQRTPVFDSIKHLWDQEVTLFSSGVDAAQMVVILAATPAFWQTRSQQLRAEAHRPESIVGLRPFFDRIPQENIIAMPAALERDEALELIVSRMSEVRPGKEELIPFTSDYVTYVYELTQGLPRTIIEICATVLGEAARRKVKKIDRPVARNILKDLLISYEPVAANT